MSRIPAKSCASLIAIFLILFLCLRHGTHERRQDGPAAADTSAVITTIVAEPPAVTTVDLVVDDETGEILGEMVNQVGDYYIINPGDEIFIPIAGHSIKTVPIE